MDNQTRKLYRSKTDRQVAGVCGGLAEYFNIDPTIVRLPFVLGLLFVGGTLLAYIILWIVVPE
jgi:phage shock protein C